MHRDVVPRPPEEALLRACRLARGSFGRRVGVRRELAPRAPDALLPPPAASAELGEGDDAVTVQVVLRHYLIDVVVAAGKAERNARRGNLVAIDGAAAFGAGSLAEKVIPF